MLVVVVMLFAVCWGPLLAHNVLVASGVLEAYHYGYLKPLRQALFLMSYLNSCLNPFVYGFMSAHFRASFRQALFSCCHFRLRKRIAFDTAASFRSRSTVVSFRCEARIHCGPRPCATRRQTTGGEEGDKGYSGVDSPSVSATSIEDRR
ncbi:hypothetical protein C0Q70_17031 [Pomacea canaliculata]|uniref:G-protein coupled receptors family 1 profile domain-containing protein n=3 Tax=Pomacea canaliculata TaxID=400727 RepID=A0A2T7NRI1_POMCA|nr:hypothetical protein C0Q70_17031 [Pomacea canaliculata]